jgi:prophage regulatory protein
MPTDVFVRAKEVTKLTGVSRSQIYRLVNLDQFPQPIKLSERCVAWSAAEIERWQKERIAQRNKELEA